MAVLHGWLIRGGVANGGGPADPPQAHGLWAGAWRWTLTACSAHD